MDPAGDLELLYEPIKGNEAHPRDDDVYPLDASTFCGAREEGKRVKLSVVNLALLGDGYGAGTMRKLVASTVLRRIEAHACKGSGTQDTPETMVVVDEAHLVMPNSGQCRRATPSRRRRCQSGCCSCTATRGCRSSSRRSGPKISTRTCAA